MAKIISGSSDTLDIVVSGVEFNKIHSSSLINPLVVELDHTLIVCEQTILLADGSVSTDNPSVTLGGGHLYMTPCLGKTDGNNLPTLPMKMSKQINESCRHQVSGVSSGTSGLIVPTLSVEKNEIVVSFHDIAGVFDSQVLSVAPVASRKITTSYHHTIDMMKKGLLYRSRDISKDSVNSNLVATVCSNAYNVDVLDYCQHNPLPHVSGKTARSYLHKLRLSAQAAKGEELPPLKPFVSMWPKSILSKKSTLTGANTICKNVRFENELVFGDFKPGKYRASAKSWSLKDIVTAQASVAPSPLEESLRVRSATSDHHTWYEPSYDTMTAQASVVFSPLVESLQIQTAILDSHTWFQPSYNRVWLLHIPCRFICKRRYTERKRFMRAQASDSPPSVCRFAKALFRNEVTFGDQRHYWSVVARMNTHRLKKFAKLLQSKFTHDMSASEGRAIQGSYKKFRDLFSKDQRFVLCGGKTELHAQGWGIPVTVNHTVDPAVLDRLSNIVDSIVGKSSGLKGRIIRFIVLIFELASNSSMASKIRSAVQCFADIDLSQTGVDIACYARSLAKVFKGVGSSNDTEELVAQAEETSHENILSSTIRLFAGMFGEKSVSDFRVDSLRVTRLCNIAKSVKSVDTIFSYVVQLVEFAYDQLQSHLTGYSVGTLRLQEVAREIPEWMKEVSEIYNAEGCARVNGDKLLADRVKNLKQRGDDYHQLLSKSRVPLASVQAYNELYRQCCEMYRSSVPNQYSDSYRKTPFSLYLVGGSGVGKSTLQKYMVSHLMSLKGIPYDPTRDLYTRNPSQDHWDGYHNQKVTLFDDFFQVLDPEIRTTLLGEIIHMINHVSYPLKMAGMDHKGMTRFTSDMVVFTSNVDLDHNIENLVANSSAVKRRRHVVARVHIHPDFQLGNTGMIDIEKTSGQLFDRDVYLFDILDASTGRVLQKNMQYDDFVIMAYKKWEMLDEREQRTCDSLATLLQDSPPPFMDAQAESTDTAFDDMCKVLQARFRTGQLTEDDFMEFVQGQMPLHHRLMCNLYHDLVRLKAALDASINELTSGIHRTIERANAALGSFPWLKAIGAITTILGMAGLLYHAFSSSKSSDDCEASVSGDEKTRKKLHKMRIESSVSGDEKTRKKKVTYAAESEEIDPDCEALVDDMIVQGSTDPQMLDILNSVVYNNLASFDVGSLRMNALCLRGHVFVAPLHAFVRTGTDDAEFTLLLRGDNEISCNISECRTHIVPDKDLIFIEIPRRRYPAFRDIVSHFHCDSDIGKYTMNKGMLANIRCMGDKRIMVLTGVASIAKEGKTTYKCNLSGTEEQLTIVNAYRYKGETSNGACGGPVLWNCSSVGKKLLGLHVAGGSGTGACTALSESVLNKYLDFFGDDIVVEAPVLKAQCRNSGPIRHSDPLHYFGNVEKNEQYRVPQKTQIVESVLHGAFMPVTKPAMLGPANGKDPMRIGISKQFGSVKMFPQEIVDECTESYLQDIMSMSNDAYRENPRLLSDDEMLNGIPGDAWIKPLNLKTSAGFPYNTSSRRMSKPGKYGLVIEDSEDHYILGAEMREKVKDRENKAKQGIAAFTLFCDTLKDERRPIEKADAGKTRVFNIGPMDFNLLCRKYLCHFIGYMYDNHVEGESSAGLNPHSSEWGSLMDHLSEKGSSYLAGDFSNYDKTLLWQLFNACLTIINRFYNDSDENQRVREVLFTSMFSAFHLCGEKVYRVYRGNPSGCVITVIINSMCNSLMSRIAYLLIGRPQFPMLTLADFRKDVRVKNYGDDNIGCVSDRASWYNMHTISGVLAPFGIVYTSATKDDILLPFVPLSEVSYLKRSFVKRDGITWAPLAMDSIREMVNWVRVCPDLELATRLNVECAMREMVHYGRRSFDNFQKIVMDCSLGKMPLDYMPYEVAMEYLLSGQGELFT